MTATTHVLRTVTGEEIGPMEVESTLATRFRGELLDPTSDGYDEARQLWNGLFEHRPALIARCAGKADVAEAVTFASDRALLMAVRGGGHNVAGTAGVDAGFVIDLSDLRDVHVAPESRIVHAGGGATWADVDAATQAHGLATPGGVVSDTGIGGLTLGGGIGWLRRKYGMSCDNLIGAEVVTAEGRHVRADEGDHAELLWGLRGGGGNFGVVTDFELQLHPVGPQVMVGMVFHHGARAADALRAYRGYTREVPDEVSSFAICGTVPAEDLFPADAWGEPYVLFMAVHAGDLRQGEELVRPLRDFAQPIVDLSGPMRYADVQRVLDGDYPTGRRYYWKSLDLGELSDEVIDLVVAHAAARPSPLSTVDVWHQGGAMARVPPEATAFGDRSAPYLLGVEANWDDPPSDDANVAWARRCAAELGPLSTGRQYLNFPGLLEEGDRTVQAAHGANYERLVRLKRQLDPTNLFRRHQNIPPTGG